ncbi:hypothetical protein V6N11_053007 [Hibiscus sabdariffa]|uniref:Uncharacterized protein n=1 Tax=Hibiscus sabdariffa TaxID=183260 RepID=A0ABR2UCC4_9ROSI
MESTNYLAVVNSCDNKEEQNVEEDALDLNNDGDINDIIKSHSLVVFGSQHSNDQGHGDLNVSKQSQPPDTKSKFWDNASHKRQNYLRRDIQGGDRNKSWDRQKSSSFGYEPNNTKGKLPAVDCDNYGNIVLAQSEVDQDPVNSQITENFQSLSVIGSRKRKALADTSEEDMFSATKRREVLEAVVSSSALTRVFYCCLFFSFGSIELDALFPLFWVFVPLAGFLGKLGLGVGVFYLDCTCMFQ